MTRTRTRTRIKRWRNWHSSSKLITLIIQNQKAYKISVFTRTYWWSNSFLSNEIRYSLLSITWKLLELGSIQYHLTLTKYILPKMAQKQVQTVVLWRWAQIVSIAEARKWNHELEENFKLVSFHIYTDNLRMQL